MNWLLVLSVIGILLIGSCVLVLQQASNSAEKVVDHSIRVTCYDSGWYDANSEVKGKPPVEGSECAGLYSRGYDDGQSSNYKPPEN